MSSELERRLEGLLTEAPEPDVGAGEEALHRALRALQPAAPTRRGLRTGILVLAATGVLLAIAAGSLAAAGALHVSFGAKKSHARPPAGQLSLPHGANGIAAIVDGRLSVVIKGGFRLQGLTASAVALSPHALYVAAGIGHSLVAMAPDGRKAWSHPTGGSVTAIAWAPDGLRIAYIVRHGHRFALRVIWGNGTHDSRTDPSVRAVRPSWRADSLAFAYVGAGGKAVVYDLGHNSRTVIASKSPVTHVAYAPSGRRLAVATPNSVEVLPHGEMSASCSTVGIGWLATKVAFACETPFLATLFPAHAVAVPGEAKVIDADGQRVAMALVNGNRVLLVAGTASRLRAVERLPRAARVTELQLG
jgi:hypothetical protein